MICAEKPRMWLSTIPRLEIPWRIVLRRPLILRPVRWFRLGVGLGLTHGRWGYFWQLSVSTFQWSTRSGSRYGY